MNLHFIQPWSFFWMTFSRAPLSFRGHFIHERKSKIQVEIEHASLKSLHLLRTVFLLRHSLYPVDKDFSGDERAHSSARKHLLPLLFDLDLKSNNLI